MEAVMGLLVMILGVSHGTNLTPSSSTMGFIPSPSSEIQTDAGTNLTPSSSTMGFIPSPSSETQTEAGTNPTPSSSTMGFISSPSSEIQTEAGLETYCDGRQDGAQCYGALGGTVVLRLMDSTSEIFRYQWSTITTVILNGRENLIVSNEIENRSSFTPSDGTLRISNLSRSDGGEYTLITFNSDGRITEQRTLQLTIQGVETHCDGRQDGAQCYGALGGTVVLRLMDSASEIFSYQWSNKTTVILYGRENLIVSNVIENRSSFTPSDGTFRINNLSWNDGGEYKLETFDSEGQRSEQRTLQLTIQG